MKHDLLFVYGTLTREFDNKMSSFLRDNSEHITEGYFPGELYDVGDYPGAVFDEDSDHQVYGDVYRLKNPAKVLRVLDEYEEVGEKFAQPNEYVRRMVTVYGIDGGTHQCWTYLYNLPTGNLRKIPSGEYSRS